MRASCLLALASVAFAHNRNPTKSHKESGGDSLSGGPYYPCKNTAQCAGQGGHRVPITGQSSDDPGQHWYDDKGVAVCRPDGYCDGLVPSSMTPTQACADMYNNYYRIKQFWFAGCVGPDDPYLLNCLGVCPCDGSCCEPVTGEHYCMTRRDSLIDPNYSAECPGVKGSPCPASSLKYKLEKEDPNGLTGSPVPSGPSPKHGPSPRPKHSPKGKNPPP